MNSMIAATAVLLFQIVGSEFIYTVRPGDSLTLIGARFGADARVIAEANDLKPSSLLKPDQSLKIDNRHIVPTIGVNTAVMINVPQRMLFFAGVDQPTQGYPIAAGKPSWKTPIATFTVAMKEMDPTWDVPVSIQAEMLRTGKPVLTHVPPSPDNPLGKYWIGLSLPAVGIHGTNAPASIYGLATHGCIRVHPDNIAVLFPQVDVGMRGRIVYEPVLIVRIVHSVFLEVHPDAYKKAGDPLWFVVERAQAGGFLDLLDMTAVEEVLRKQDGLARDVTRR